MKTRPLSLTSQNSSLKFRTACLSMSAIPVGQVRVLYSVTGGAKGP